MEKTLFETYKEEVLADAVSLGDLADALKRLSVRPGAPGAVCEKAHGRRARTGGGLRL